MSGYELGGPSFCLGTLVQDVSVGSYQVKRLLYREQNFHAYLAVQQGQQQPVSLKIFFPDPFNQHLWEQGRYEAIFVAGLKHSAILPLLDCAFWVPGLRGPQNAFPQMRRNTTSLLYAAYQYAPFTMLTLLPARSGRTRSVRLSSYQLVQLIHQGASALAAAHGQGLVHGALQPDHIFFNGQLDRLWIADFGLARLYPPDEALLAPELLPVCEYCRKRGDVSPYWEAVTPASDQYSLAVLCSQLLTHYVDPTTYQRMLPVLQYASLPNPAARFKLITDFSSALTEALTASPLLPTGTTLSGSLPTAPTFPSATPASGRPQSSPLSPLESSRGPKVDSAPLASSTHTSGSLTNPAATAEYWEQTAGKAFTARDYEAAEQAYVQATRIDASRASTWLGLGDSYFALQRYAEALDAYSQAIKLEPDNADAWFNRGTVYDMLGRSDRAALDYERADMLRSRPS